METEDVQKLVSPLLENQLFAALGGIVSLILLAIVYKNFSINRQTPFRNLLSYATRYANDKNKVCTPLKHTYGYAVKFEIKNWNLQLKNFELEMN